MNQLERLVDLAYILGPLLIGYFLRRHSEGKPLIRHRPKPKDQGPKDDPGGDPFEEALAPIEDANERLPTMNP